jgi:hypothetical protein
MTITNTCTDRMLEELFDVMVMVVPLFLVKLDIPVWSKAKRRIYIFERTQRAVRGNNIGNLSYLWIAQSNCRGAL